MTGAANEDTLAGADVVLLAVPYDGHDDLVAALADGLAGKVVVCCVNPLGFDKQGPYGLDVDRSAAESAAALVPTARVTGAFHHVSAVTLWGDEEYLSHEDVLVCGDDADAVDVVVELASTVTGRPGVDGRPAADGPPAGAADGRADLDQQGVQDAVGGGDLGGAWLRVGFGVVGRSVGGRNSQGIEVFVGHRGRKRTPTSQSLLTSQGVLALPAALGSHATPWLLVVSDQ